MREVKLGLLWSKEDAEKAAHKHAFIRVSDSDKRSYRHISGAERMWTQPETEDEIYLLNFRVSGKSQDIETALLNAGYSPEQIETALEDAVTSKNYQKGKKKPFEEELSSLIEFKREEKERKQRSTAIDWGTLLQIASHVKEAHIVMKEKGTSPKRTTGRGKTLIERFEEIQGQEGKMIDVSEMRDDGTGVKIQGRPSTERGQKVFLASIPILSKSHEKYMRALEMLFNAGKFDSESEYQKTINAAEAKFIAKGKSKAK